MLAGERPVRVFRDYRGLTQKQLARTVGISPLYLSQIERGIHNGSVATLAAIARALSVELDDLLEAHRGGPVLRELLPGATHAAEPVSATRASSTWARLIKQVYEVDPLICEKCGFEMKVIAVILDPSEIQIILRHLIKVGRAPPAVQAASLN